MLPHPTLATLQALKLMGLYHALLEQRQMPEIPEGSVAERLGLLVERASTAREDRRLQSRLPQAKLRQTACIEDIDYRHPRGWDKALLRSLAPCQGRRDRPNVLLTGPTGSGKPRLFNYPSNRVCVFRPHGLCH
jgi:DNA replication protein DnaC